MKSGRQKAESQDATKSGWWEVRKSGCQEVRELGNQEVSFDNRKL